MRIEQTEHCTLYLGDCLDVLPTLGKVDAVVTDPPYGLGMRTVSGGTSKNTQTRFIEEMKESQWDSLPPGKDVFDSLARISRFQIIFGGNYFPLPPTRCFFVWDKMTFVPTMSRVEMAWTNMDGPAKFICFNSNQPDRCHPTQKPVQVMQWCLEHLPPGADLVLDPFMGSGTTGVACVNTGRRFVGIEKEPKYFEIALKRIREAERLANCDLFKEPKSTQTQGVLC